MTTPACVGAFLHLIISSGLGLNCALQPPECVSRVVGTDLPRRLYVVWTSEISWPVELNSGVLLRNRQRDPVSNKKKKCRQFTQERTWATVLLI